MLTKVVTEFLEKQIPERIERIEAGEEPAPFIRIRSENGEFGDIELYDDGDEVTIVFGRFTHSHYSNYDDIPLEQKEDQIAEDVFDVITDTLNDKLEFWGSHEGSGGGQDAEWAAAKKRGLLSRILNRGSSRTYYRWSGATRKTRS